MLLEDALGRLDSVIKTGAGKYRARCPVHQGDGRSLALKRKENGHAFMTCFVGCDRGDIERALGGKPFIKRDHLPRQERKRLTFRTEEGAIEFFKAPVLARHPYTSADGSPLFTVVRMRAYDGSKMIRPIMFDPALGLYRFSLPPAPRPLYNLYRIVTEDDVVVVTEGEKAADAVCDAGWIGTTSVGGSSATRNTDWKPLEGRMVVIWPDNDEPGAKYAAEVERRMRESYAFVKVMAPVGGPGDDAADLDVNEVRRLLLEECRGGW